MTAALTCAVWPTGAGPCGEAAAEVLVFLNELCGGRANGELPVCPQHLAEYRAESLL